jgi:hypothetical protein
MSVKDEEKRICTVCKKEKNTGLKTNGDRYKICVECREKKKICRDRNKCIHDKQKNQCRDCNGSAFCIHDKYKTQCRECNGSSFCEHDKIRYQCRECNGSAFCIHDKHKPDCRECGGSSICEHDKHKSNCIICNPHKACQNCFSVFVTPRYRFNPYCFMCYCVLNPDANIPRQFKLKEHHMRDVLLEKFPETVLVFDKKVTNGCSRRRPDVRIECLTHTLIIECDEHAHKNTPCESKRTMELFNDLGNRPLVMLRFNPDKNSTSKGCFSNTKTGSLSLNKKEWHHRTKILCEKIQFYLDEIPKKEVTIVHLFY